MGIGADRFARQSNQQFYGVPQCQVKERAAKASIPDLLDHLATPSRLAFNLFPFSKITASVV
jgi:hypothetical protein